MPGLEPIAPHRRPVMDARSVRRRFAAAMVLAVIVLVVAAFVVARTVSWLWPF